MSRPVRFGVLGCADIARRRIVPALLADPDAEVTAVAARDPGRAARFAAELGCAATDYTGLVEREDVDVVYLPLPPGLHAQWTRRALLAGKHVWVEKPLAPNAADARALVRLALDRGLVLRENFMFVHHRQHLAVRDAVAAGVLGLPFSVEASFCIPARPEGDIRYRPDLAGGALVDLGVYPLRLAQLLFGPGIEVTSASLETDPVRGVDVAGCVRVAWPGGVTGVLRFRLGGEYECEYTVRGDARSVRVERAFTPPADWVPRVRFDDGGGLVVAAQDQVADAVAAVVAAVRAADVTAESASAVRTAELLDEVRALAAVSAL